MTSKTWTEILDTLVRGESLTVAESAAAMTAVMNGEVSDAQLAGFLVALRVKGESVDEVVGFRDAILSAALPLDVSTDAVDIVGSGGDPIGVLNVSSIAAMVVAAAGTPVIKHGNRAASSKSGANDVLSALGINISLEPARVAQVFAEIGVTFVNAMVFHPGFKNAGPVRSQLGIPTIFNVLGPLCNPARPEANALGMANAARIPLSVGLFQQRGATALVYRGEDGIDKITTTGHSHVVEVTRGSVTQHDFDPREIGFTYSTLDAIRGGTPEENADTAKRVLAGEKSPARDIIVLNSAAGIVAHKLSNNVSERDRSFVERMAEAVAIAEHSIDSGAAAAKLDAWVAATQ
ncbi:MAG: anthranilate phosphoribosyltransferase [Actinomycetota bacterium]